MSTPITAGRLTSVSHSNRMDGPWAAELLFARLDGYEGPSRQRLIATKLIERRSGEIHLVTAAATVPRSQRGSTAWVG